jgi:hypothetical protein
MAASAKRQQEMLLQARKQLQETEEVGADTLHNLAKQRETILRTQKNVQTMNEELDHSSRIMTRLSRFWRG